MTTYSNTLLGIAWFFKKRMLQPMATTIKSTFQNCTMFAIGKIFCVPRCLLFDLLCILIRKSSILIIYDEFPEDTSPRTAIARTCPFAWSKIPSISNILQCLVAILQTAMEKTANKHPLKPKMLRADGLAKSAAWVLLFESKQYSACSANHRVLFLLVRIITSRNELRAEASKRKQGQPCESLLY